MYPVMEDAEEGISDVEEVVRSPSQLPDCLLIVYLCTSTWRTPGVR